MPATLPLDLDRYPVDGPTRLIALLSFDREPGMVFAAPVQLNNTGRTTHV